MLKGRWQEKVRRYWTGADCRVVPWSNPRRVVDRKRVSRPRVHSLGRHSGLIRICLQRQEPSSEHERQTGARQWVCFYRPNAISSTRKVL